MSGLAAGDTLSLPTACSNRLEALGIAAAGTIVYAGLVRELAATWRDDPYYSYAALVPVFSVYVWWTARHDLGLRDPSLGPALAAALAALILSAGLISPALAVRALAIPIGVTAGILAVHGARALRRLIFPLGFLLLLAPVPHEALVAVSPLLQRLAAIVAERSLSILAIPVGRMGLELHIGSDTLEITEACNGLRFLLTMAVVGVALAWSIGRTPGARLTIVALAIVTAIAANLGRVTVTAILTYLVGVVPATGPGHLVYGKGVYVLFAGALFVSSWLVWGRRST